MCWRSTPTPAGSTSRADDLRGAGRRDAAARRDAGGGAAAQDHHRGRRGRRRRHRGHLVPPGPGARHAARTRRAAAGRRGACTARRTTSTATCSTAFPNSYGTLGYALRLRLRTLPVKPFVRVEHRRCRDRAATSSPSCPRSCRRRRRLRRRRGVRCRPAGAERGPLRRRRALAQRLQLRADLLPLAAATSRLDYLTARRTTSGAGTPTGSGARRTSARSTRWCAGCSAAPAQLAHLHALMRWNARWGLTRALDAPARPHPRVGDPGRRHPAGARARSSWHFLLREIGILPIWVCPLRAPTPGARVHAVPAAPRRRT